LISKAKLEAHRVSMNLAVHESELPAWRVLDFDSWTTCRRKGMSL
jgi:hypothetical protein